MCEIIHKYPLTQFIKHIHIVTWLKCTNWIRYCKTILYISVCKQQYLFVCFQLFILEIIETLYEYMFKADIQLAPLQRCCLATAPQRQCCLATAPQWWCCLATTPQQPCRTAITNPTTLTLCNPRKVAKTFNASYRRQFYLIATPTISKGRLFAAAILHKYLIKFTHYISTFFKRQFPRQIIYFSLFLIQW